LGLPDDQRLGLNLLPFPTGDMGRSSDPRLAREPRIRSMRPSPGAKMELYWKTWVTPNTRGKPLGWASAADWADIVRVLRQYGGFHAA
jgi:hypothetical protein